MSPILFGYVSSLLPNWIAKEKVFKYFFSESPRGKPRGILQRFLIKEVLNLEQFEYIYAYGDSKVDREMLSIADESFYKLFK